ncbi:MAG: zinc ribbon domain-containing protein [Candidatus Micrarchaeota archaeon]
MEIRDIAVILIIVLGVVALKGFYDLFLSMPIWVFYIAVIAVFAFAGIGFFMVAESMFKNPNFNAGAAVLMADPKKAIYEASNLWLRWPWWAVMLAAWKVFEPFTREPLGVFMSYVGIGPDFAIPLLGSPFEFLTIFATYVALVCVTGLFLLINPVSIGRGRTGSCPRCGAKHSVADNYCSNCGAILPKKG